MNFGSLFSGIGGIDLGLERAGMTCKWQVEIDDFCQKVLDKHWPEVTKFRDVREVGKHNLEPVDLIAGGFPCQPHSVAGKRRGKDDDRNLWPEYLRIIREIRPTWVVGENVPGIITTMLDDVLADLESTGYTPTVFNIPAAAFGANHIRYRIIVVAHTMHNGFNQSLGLESDQRGQHMETQKQGGRDQRGIVEPHSKDMANADHNRRDSRRALGGDGLDSNDRQRDAETGGEVRSEWKREFGEVGYLSNTGKPRLEGAEQSGYYEKETGGRQACATGSITESLGNGWTNWSVEPNVGRVAHGIPNRVDRLKSLGNAVVPQVAEFVGRCILEAELDNPVHH